MSKYVIALQVLAWLFVAYIISLVFKYLISLKKMNRLSYFSLNIENKKQSDGCDGKDNIKSRGNPVKNTLRIP